MGYKLETTECKKYFGLDYGDLLRLQKHNETILKDKSMPNELYAKIITLDYALLGIMKLFK